MKRQLPNQLGAVVRDYFTDHLPRLRGTSPHTIHSYRDSLVLLLRFLSARQNLPPNFAAPLQRSAHDGRCARCDGGYSRQAFAGVARAWRTRRR